MKLEAWLVLAITVLAGCTAPPTESSSEETTSPTSTTPGPTPTDTAPGPLEDVEQLNRTPKDRPVYLTDCGVQYTSIEGDLSPVQEALPDGWTATTTAAGLGPSRAFWLDCEGFSRDNRTLQEQASLLLAGVNVEPPREYNHGGGADFFVFWALSDPVLGPLRNWSFPVYPGVFDKGAPVATVEEAQGNGRSFMMSGERVQETEIQSQGELYLHYANGESIRTIRYGSNLLQTENLVGPGRIHGAPWDETTGPMTASTYTGTVSLDLEDAGGAKP